MADFFGLAGVGTEFDSSHGFFDILRSNYGSANASVVGSNF
jgi:hypothetical protein